MVTFGVTVPSSRRLTVGCTDLDHARWPVPPTSVREHVILAVNQIRNIDRIQGMAWTAIWISASQERT